jgi:hypothetical protein
LLKVAEARVTSKKEGMRKAADQAHLEHMQRLEEERANA